MPQNKVVQYKKPFQINIGIITFALVILYIGFVLFAYISKEHVSIYEVPEAKISDDSTLTGVILRREKVIKTPYAGYINYYNPAGNRIGVNDLIYSIDGTGQISNLLADVDQKAKITSDSIEQMRDVISNFQTNLNDSNFKNVYDYQYEVENVVFEQSKASIYADLVNVLKRTGNSQTFHQQNSPQSGIVSYTIDGFENLNKNRVQSTLFSKSSALQKTQLRGLETVKKGEPVYKLITSQQWTLMVPINTKYYTALKGKTEIPVKIKKDNMTFKMSLQLESRGDGLYAILSSSSFLNRYLNDRFLDVEIHLNEAEGLKIPKNSILKKEFYMIPKSFINTQEPSGRTFFNKQIFRENGTKDIEYVQNTTPILINNMYYVSKDKLHIGDVLLNQSQKNTFIITKVSTLENVYCVNEGSCQFVRIEKIYENPEYTIVNPKTDQGLSVYDHIVLNPTKLNENDFIS